MNGTINIQLTIVTSKEGKQYIQRWPKDKNQLQYVECLPKALRSGREIEK